MPPPFFPFTVPNWQLFGAFPNSPAAWFGRDPHWRRPASRAGSWTINLRCFGELREERPCVLDLCSFVSSSASAQGVEAACEADAIEREGTGSRQNQIVASLPLVRGRDGCMFCRAGPQWTGVESRLFQRRAPPAIGHHTIHAR